MRETYEEMIKGLPAFGGDVLAPSQLKAVMAYISALSGAPAEKRDAHQARASAHTRRSA